MNRISVLLIILLSSCSEAKEQSINFPQDEKQRLTTLNLSLTTERLYKAYMSSDINQRRLAEMYVAGVIDSTEGMSWCGYGVASPDAIQEQVFAGLSTTLKKSPETRASTAIKLKLEELLPCKERK